MTILQSYGESRVLYAGKSRELRLDGVKGSISASKITVEVPKSWTGAHLIVLERAKPSEEDACKPGPYFHVYDRTDINCSHSFNDNEFKQNALIIDENTKSDRVCFFVPFCISSKHWIRIKLYSLDAEGRRTEITAAVPDLYISIYYK